MSGRVAGYADDGPFREEFSGDRHRHISLPKMYSIGTDGQSNVYPIIDQNRDTVAATYVFRLLGDI